MSAFYQLRNIARIRKYLSHKTTEFLVHAFVSLKLDFCNSRLYGIPKYLQKLQSVQNAAVRLVTSSKFDHITPLLMQLHWLPIAKCITLFFSPSKVFTTYHLPTSKSSQLHIVLHACLMHFNMRSYGARAFAISALEFWNQLPNDIKSIDNLTTFKSKLKPSFFYCRFQKLILSKYQFFHFYFFFMVQE